MNPIQRMVAGAQYFASKVYSTPGMMDLAADPSIGGYRKFLNEQRGQSIAQSIIGAVLGFIVVFYVIAYTYTPLEDASGTLQDKLSNATISGVSGLSSLPGVAILLFILMAILSLILMAVGSKQV